MPDQPDQPIGIICTSDYVEAHLKAERRLRKGERQLYCDRCGGKWVWPEECQHKGRLTEKQFKAAERRAKRRKK